MVEWFRRTVMDSDVVSNILLILGFIAMANTVCR